MKRTRRVAVPALGVVRQRTGEDAPEGAASDCVNMRLKDGALRPVGDAEQLTTLPANASAQAVLFHSALPDGEYLYRISTTIYHRKATGDVAVMDFAGESFVSWKAFGTALIVVTDKYTRVAVLKDGSFISFNVLTDNDYITFNHNHLKGQDYSVDVDLYEKNEKTNEITSLCAEYKTDLVTKNKLHGCAYVIFCITLTDGSIYFQSAPSYIQYGSVLYDITKDGIIINVQSTSAKNMTGNVQFTESYPQRASYSPQSEIGATTDDYKAIFAYSRFSNPSTFTYTGITGGVLLGKGYAIPNITITIPQSFLDKIILLKENNLASDISIYSTRFGDVYDIDACFKQLHADMGYSTAKIRELDVAGPYFLLKNIPISSQLTSVIDIDIKAEDFYNIEQNNTLGPNSSRHNIRPTSFLTEYNSRLHACGINTKLSSGDVFITPLHVQSATPLDIQLTPTAYGYTSYSSGIFTAYIETTILIDGINYIVNKSIPISNVLFRKRDGTTSETKFAIILPPIVAYPDARATLMRLILVNGSGSHFEAMNIPLKACLEGNFAYAKGTNTDINITQPPFLKVIEPKLTSRWDANLQVEVSEWVFSSDSLPTIPNPPSESREFTQTNRLQVYNYGSPLTYELKNSYRFGASSEQLLRCEAAVDQLSEGRFGQFPLYCFTDCGLYALEQGSGEVLYATSHPISADGLISPDGVTPVRGGVAFVTSKGVMFVSGRQVIELSGPIRGAAEYYDAATGLPDVFRFMDVSAALGGPQEPALKTYLAGAELHQLYNEGELIAYNRQYAYAWVYSMESKMWYRRQLPYTNIQRVGTSLISYAIMPARGSQVPALYRSNIEREQSYSNKPMLYISRPLEFGSNGYKKLEGAMARISNTSGGLVHICILGSIDGVRYGKIQGATVVAKENTISDIMLGRSGISVRSVVVAILFDANMRTTVERFDFDLEDRFTSRLR